MTRKPARTHLRDAEFHLGNAVKSLERAVDEAPDGKRFGRWQQSLGLASRHRQTIRDAALDAQRIRATGDRVGGDLTMVAVAGEVVADIEATARDGGVA